MTVSLAAFTDEAIWRKGVPTYPVNDGVLHMCSAFNRLDQPHNRFVVQTSRFDSCLPLLACDISVMSSGRHDAMHASRLGSEPSIGFHLGSLAEQLG